MAGSLLLVALGMSLAAAPAAQEPFGAIATSPLDRGALAMYAVAGYPEVRVGFREGMSGYEIGAEAGLDVLVLRAYGAAATRVRLYEQGHLRLSADLQAGVFASSGVRYADDQNEGGAGMRLQLGSTLTFITDWPVSFNAYLRAPIEIALGDSGTTRLGALVGGAAELALTPDLFVSFGGGFGPEYRRHLLSERDSTQLAVEAMIGVGYRMF
jgi:hypothetical protein